MDDLRITKMIEIKDREIHGNRIGDIDYMNHSWMQDPHQDTGPRVK